MNNCEHIVGLIYDYEDYELMTFRDLVKYVGSKSSCYSLKDYCDKRKSTNFQHFNYCPDCGRKINWDKIRKEIL